MELIMQPKKSKLCGQCTIAMLSGITLDESIKLFGHSRTSYFSDYTRVLKALDIPFTKNVKVDNRKKYELPKKCMVRLQFVGRKTGHLIAYEDGKFYDSSRGIFNSKEELMSSYNDNSTRKTRIDWYMEILENDELLGKCGSN